MTLLQVLKLHSVKNNQETVVKKDLVSLEVLVPHSLWETEKNCEKPQLVYIIRWPSMS